MIYEEDLTIPASTPETSPVETLIEVTAGVIHRIEVQFPPGCFGLAHVVIVHENTQIFPTNPGQSFKGDAWVFSVNEYHVLDEPPFIITVRGWNEDDTYEHTITVRICILPEAVVNVAATLQRIYELWEQVV